MSQPDRHRQTLPAPPGLSDAGAWRGCPAWSSSAPESPAWPPPPGSASAESVSTSWKRATTSAAGSAAGPTPWPTVRRSAMNRGFHAFFRQYYNLRDLAAPR